MANTTDKTGEVNWGSIAAPVTVAQLAPEKSIEDIPATIRQWIDAALKDGDVKAVVLPSEVAVKLFQREARDYGYLHTPRLTVRIKVIGKSTEVRYTAKPYVAPAAKPAAKSA